MGEQTHLFGHVPGEVLCGVHREHGAGDLLIGQLELGEEDGAVLGAPAIDEGQLLGLGGLDGPHQLLCVLTLLLVCRERAVKLMQVQDLDYLCGGEYNSYDQ